MRVFCPQAKKTKFQYESREAAEIFIMQHADKIRRQHGYAPVHAYYCSSCGCFHTTSQVINPLNSPFTAPSPMEEKALSFELILDDYSIPDKDIDAFNKERANTNVKRKHRLTQLNKEEEERHRLFKDDIKAWAKAHPSHKIRADSMLQYAAEINQQYKVELAYMPHDTKQIEDYVSKIKTNRDARLKLITDSRTKGSTIDHERHQQQLAAIAAKEEQEEAERQRKQKEAAEEAERKRLEGIALQQAKAAALKKAKEETPVVSETDEELVFEPEPIDPDEINIEVNNQINVALLLDADGNDLGIITLSNWLGDHLSKQGYSTVNLARLGDSQTLAFGRKFRTPVDVAENYHYIIHSAKFSKSLLESMGDPQEEQKNYRFELKTNSKADYCYLILHHK